MSKVLLTGATGFIGSHMLEALLSNGYEVVVLKRSTSSLWRIESLLSSCVTFDLDKNDFEDIFKNNEISSIIHLATKYVKYDDGSGVAEMFTSNVTFPAQLIELAARFNVKCFINTGTFFEYDCSQLPESETAKIKPFNLYAKTKNAFENIAETYKEYMDVVTFRLFSPYGEKDNEKLIPMVLRKALNEEEIHLSDGMQKLDFIYVQDIVDAYIKALAVNLKKQEHGSYSLYNLGSGTPTSVREIVSVVEQKIGRPLNIKWGNPAILDIPVAYADIKKIKKEIDWKPKNGIHEGIEKTLEYFKSEK